MKLGLIAAMVFMATAASAEPLDGPAEGKLDVPEGQTVLQPMTLLKGSTTFRFTAQGGEIDCGAFDTTGESVIVDDRDDNECNFVVTAEDTTDVIIAVKNNGPGVAHVVGSAR